MKIRLEYGLACRKGGLPLSAVRYSHKCSIEKKMTFQGQVHSLWRYPIKGFRGEKLPNVDLEPNAGIAGDRQWALSDGDQSVSEDGSWHAPRHFMRMFIDRTLPLYEWTVQKGQLPKLVGVPGGAADQEADIPTTLNQKHSGQPRFHKRPAGEGYWDYPDACLSIINIASIGALEAEMECELDPLRFRANIYVEALAPWEEWNWIGRQIQIGDAVLETLRPIDRCRVTSLNPETGEEGPNVPAALMRNFGHLFMGVYARVVHPGQISCGDEFRLRKDEPDISFLGQPANAPLVASWPRLAKVVSRTQETEKVISLWLEDPFREQWGEIPAGGHLKLHLRDGAGSFWRCYTLSGEDRENGRLRISVKREQSPARASGYLHGDLLEGGGLMISGPHAAMPDIDTDRPVIIVSAGIGITMTLSVLNRLGTKQPARIIHVARNGADLALWKDVLSSLAGMDSVSANLFLTKPDCSDRDRWDFVEGRPSLPKLMVQAAEIGQNSAAYLCGPLSFMADTTDALVSAGIDPAHIHRDFFISPGSGKGERIRPKEKGPFKLRLSRSGEIFTWEEQQGSLLDFLESRGINVTSGCRSGACQACRLPLPEGKVHHLYEPAIPLGPDSLLSCCAVPQSDIVLDL